ncbi:hypothetical protein BGZ61DRAFT_521332 [Ilyonectria robusta]|uniref:uncharacterized protein n=1 Tax=Ilyonectria robusta TaxID=1079257 RepID=UPI001E8D1574|nr:uncharacterized protein BGZ61DRAFT_521332 [Ilyonectria robusta]KAH8672298.1 hypothetical protein BGZ61DRAFT_521332 [Ilyonectria robusta]
MKFSLSLLALLSVGEAIVIEPRSKTRAASFVSFEQWVENIIANPEGEHLTPDEAIGAHEAIINSTDIDLEARALEKRVYCYDNVQDSAPAGDAAECINYLASIGGRDCTVHSGSQQLFRRIRGARIWGQIGGGNNAPATDSCQNVARTGGRIMDSCTRNGQVRGFELVNNQRFGVGITGT